MTTMDELGNKLDVIIDRGNKLDERREKEIKKSKGLIKQEQWLAIAVIACMVCICIGVYIGTQLQIQHDHLVAAQQASDAALNALYAVLIG